LRCGDLGEFRGRNRAITRRGASGARVRSARPRCSRTSRSRPSWRNISRFLAWRAMHWTIRSQRRLALEFRVQQANARLVVRSGRRAGVHRRIVQAPSADEEQGDSIAAEAMPVVSAARLRSILDRHSFSVMRKHVRLNTRSCWIALDAYRNKDAFPLTIHGDLCANFREYWREIGMNAGLPASG